MKRIPAGILFATLAFTSPLLHAEESAEQLSQQELGPDQNLSDESASQLSNQDLGPGQKMQDQSASQLSNQDLGPDQNMQDESARNLAEKEDLEKKDQTTGSAPTTFGTGEGVDGTIYAVATQADGSVIIGGRFNNVSSQPRLNLARLTADGTLDRKFLAAPTDGVDGTVYALALDAQGNLLVAGDFSTAQDQPQKNFVRYLASGQLDTGFNGGQGPNGPVYAVVLQPGGKILIGGEFSQIGSAPRRNLARYNTDGTLDGPITSADASTGAVRSLAALPNGGILAGGQFNITGQTARNILTIPAP